MSEERAYWLAWSQISGIGPVLLQRLHQYFGSLQTAWEANAQEFGAIDGFGWQTIQKVANQRTIFQKNHLHPENFLTQHLIQNPHFWTPTDSQYPRLLLETASPPAVLYYRGEVELPENLGQIPLVGIVGTRQPSEYGIKWTRKISTVLAKNGFTVVSGLAEGIDTESHTATLQGGGRTIAILGTGVDVVYPAKNQKLYQEILKQGLVISEYSSKTPPDRAHFPRRNRIIAGLCRAVLVMEAPEKSGALITADYANEFGRDVYTLPARIDDMRSQGCLKLLTQGATPILKELDELLKMLGAIPQLDFVPEPEVAPQIPPDLAPELQQVIAILSSTSLPFDTIVNQTGIEPGLVSSALLQLELMGLVSQQPGMRYQRI
ncbi:DNA-processing protein DprA [Calothrix sp. UHCC 0171]|uniref:DNA-processing protein DprA n=1 Tax=Calothrix sp. UHCC 0171 TaxID=3110245 RepID=UPI002B22191A|nr:DNA-processing protein DprA [Calothrix sp. UHCC 0171]MEA5570173.1 DNA-processing protein DprA [Calothrix sp. UHCC 0171]